MTVPKKKRGFRSIVVQGETFNWNIDRYIDIRFGIFQETRLHVEVEWVDSRIPVGERSYLNNLTITPKLIEEAIQFALQKGWNPHTKTNEVFLIRFEKGTFHYDQKFT